VCVFVKVVECDTRLTPTNKNQKAPPDISPDIQLKTIIVNYLEIDWRWVCKNLPQTWKRKQSTNEICCRLNTLYFWLKRVS